MHGKGAGVEENCPCDRCSQIDNSGVEELHRPPYLVRLLNAIIPRQAREGWKWTPLQLASGGNEQSDWIQVPNKIESFNQIQAIIVQLIPSPDATNTRPKVWIDGRIDQQDAP